MLEPAAAAAAAAALPRRPSLALAGEEPAPADCAEDAALLAEGAQLLARAAALQSALPPPSLQQQQRQPLLPLPCGPCLTSWTALSLHVRLAFLVTTLALLGATFMPSSRGGMQCRTCHGAPPERVRAASLAWARGAWARAPQPAPPPLLPQEDFVFLGTAEPFHNFSRGCGGAAERAGALALRWQPRASTAPAYLPWDRAATCAALRGSTLVVVGDSLSGEFFDTLVAALAHRPDYGNVPRLHRCWRRRICGAPGEVPAYAHLIDAATLQVDDPYGNEFSNPAGAGGAGDGWEDAEGGAGGAPTPGGQPCAPVPNQDALAGRMAWREQLAIALDAEPASGGRAPPPPVLIANTGAHYYGDNPGAEQSVWAFFEYAALLSPRASLFYRTTPAGHPGCASRRQDPPLPAPLPLEAYLADEATARFMWWRFANFTARVAAGLPAGVVVVDVDLATSLRVDSHPFRQSLQGLGAAATEDCLHYCIPGPVDLWVEMWAALLRLQRLGEAR